MQILKLQWFSRFVQIEYLHAAVSKAHAYLIVVLHELHGAQVVGRVLGLEYLAHFASAPWPNIKGRLQANADTIVIAPVH